MDGGVTLPGVAHESPLFEPLVIVRGGGRGVEQRARPGVALGSSRGFSQARPVLA
ncbi:hypothetical protein [Parafrankia sp. CH37]|uniref:hypothetical protein n=1 Tax=Parafrankia sp. CH37 TaxID=683308 RepID=UPI001D01EFA3|nr:hypothetical protein [Parafrankia sp. CH37]